MNNNLRNLIQLLNSHTCDDLETREKVSESLIAMVRADEREKFNAKKVAKKKEKKQKAADEKKAADEEIARKIADEKKDERRNTTMKYALYILGLISFVIIVVVFIVMPSGEAKDVVMTISTAVCGFVAGQVTQPPPDNDE